MGRQELILCSLLPGNGCLLLGGKREPEDAVWLVSLPGTVCYGMVPLLKYGLLLQCLGFVMVEIFLPMHQCISSSTGSWMYTRCFRSLTPFVLICMRSFKFAFQDERKWQICQYCCVLPAAAAALAQPPGPGTVAGPGSGWWRRLTCGPPLGKGDWASYVPSAVSGCPLALRLAPTTLWEGWGSSSPAPGGRVGTHPGCTVAVKSAQ